MNKRSVIQSDFESDSDSLEEAQVRFRDYTFQQKYIYFLGTILILEIFTQEEDDDVNPEEFVEP